MLLTDEKIVKRLRKFYDEDFDVTNWERIKKEMEDLLRFQIKNPDDLIIFWEKYSELLSIVDEEMAWRYIKMTCNADKEEYESAYNKFFAEILTPMRPFDFNLRKKFYDCEFRKDLKEPEFELLNRVISNDIELYREENNELSRIENEISNKYGSIYSKMTVDFDGEEKTISQLRVYLKNNDRSIREKAWKLRSGRLNEDVDKLDILFDELREVRMKQAENAGFKNYRDYKHQQLGRFSYTPDDLLAFHKAVETEVIPFLKKLTEERRKILKIETVRPWDKDVDLDGKVLKPFENTNDFVKKTIKVLQRVKNEYGENLNKMWNTKLLDLENRKGKAPGGYNYPLEELGTSFIFMNAVGLHSDAVTLLHESGHAMHSFATSKLSITDFKSFPSEVAELASMSMEMLTMDYWDEYYKNESDLYKAKRDQLEGALMFLPWCMTVDAFQHWIYTNPSHTAKERAEEFGRITDRFNIGIDWSNLDKEKHYSWMLQPHIFEVPFYYIEYGMAQLGALAIYKNYREDKSKVIENYQKFLDAAYKKPVDQLYGIAGINFNFSADYIKEILDFIQKELSEYKS